VTHYLVAGDGEPVILLHGGAPGSSASTSWSNNLVPLADRFRVYAVDRIGFGLSDKPDIAYTDQVVQEHLADFIDVLCLTRVHVVGHSLGAYVAARFAVDHPERVAKLVMVSAAPVVQAMEVPFPIPPARAAQDESVRRFLDQPARETLRAVLEGFTFFPDALTDGTVEAHLANVCSVGGMNALRSRVTPIPEQPDLWQRYCLRYRLPKLTHPLMLVWGAEDRPCPVEMAHRLRDALPNLVALRVISDAGHHVQGDQPHTFNDLVVRFLGDSAPATSTDGFPRFQERPTP
jgi:pimeloyl-ACP methyl ester carboxylesterase